MKTLELRFADEEGRTSLIGIPYPKESLTSEEISGAMDALIRTQAFQTKDALLQKKVSARIVERHIQPIELLEE